MNFNIKDKRILAVIFASIAISLVLSSIFDFFNISKNNAENDVSFIFSEFKEISEDDVIEKIDNEDIAEITKNKNNIYFEDGSGNKYSAKNTENIASELMLNNIVPTSTEIGNGVSENIVSYRILKIILTLVCVFFTIRTIKSIKDSENGINATPAAIGNTSDFVKSKMVDDKPSTRFKDVEGIDELKSDIERIVDCLTNRRKYISMGARMPKGVILYGPPGTGKTLIARAIAGEAKVPFISANGSDFVEMYVGVGAKRVRELYSRAKSKAPCIVFIDEIDAIAGKRGKDDNTEREQTINALLGELDGFSGNEGVVTICATNRLDMIDDAFKRAGRFDLKLAVSLPDKESRLNILKIHSKNKRISLDINLEDIAKKTVGFSGADLETLLNEAALLAASRNKNAIEPDDIEDSFFKIIMQGNKKKKLEIDDELKVVSYHEAGHTIVSKMVAGDTVSSVTIVQSSSGAGGATFRTPSETGLRSKRYLKSLIMTMYAGRAAEEIFFGNTDEITTGASQDIKQATQIIREYIALYGMGEKGMLDLTQFSNDLESSIEEASALANELYEEAINFLKNQNTLLNEMASALLISETLYEKEIDGMIEKYKV